MSNVGVTREQAERVAETRADDFIRPGDAEASRKLGGGPILMPRDRTQLSMWFAYRRADGTVGSRIVWSPWEYPREARRANESDEQWAQRLLTFHLFYDASDTEIADVTELPVDTITAARRELDRSIATRIVIARARQAAEQLGYRGRPSELVLEAIDEYVRRAPLRAALAVAADVGATTPATTPEERQSASAAGRETTNERAGQRAQNVGGAHQDRRRPAGVAASAAVKATGATG